MGVNTNYLGHVDIVPGLNKAEYDYLNAFSRTRRSVRPGGPYAVEPADPHSGDVDRYNAVNPGQPGYWCQWAPCPHGCCLSWNGHEKFYAGPAWLQYVIDHFLRAGAMARTSGDPQFVDFTFNHRVDGVIVGEQQDQRELFALDVVDGDVSTSILRRGDPVWGQAGFRDLSDRPWMDDEPRTEWSNDLQARVPICAEAQAKARGLGGW